MATVQLDTHFVEAGKIGEILISRPRVVRSTRSLIFMTTEVTVDEPLHRDGEWRVQDFEEREFRTRRHCEERSDEAIHGATSGMHGLLRCARNDER